jgi:hypothetical protein
MSGLNPQAIICAPSCQDKPDATAFTAGNGSAHGLRPAAGAPLVSLMPMRRCGLMMQQMRQWRAGRTGITLGWLAALEHTAQRTRRVGNRHRGQSVQCPLCPASDRNAACREITRCARSLHQRAASHAADYAGGGSAVATNNPAANAAADHQEPAVFTVLTLREAVLALTPNQSLASLPQIYCSPRRRRH